jgi:hypothetical protein
MPFIVRLLLTSAYVASVAGGEPPDEKTRRQGPAATQGGSKPIRLALSADAKLRINGDVLSRKQLTELIVSADTEPIVLELDNADYDKYRVETLAGIVSRMFTERGERSPIRVMVEGRKNRTILTLTNEKPKYARELPNGVISVSHEGFRLFRDGTVLLQTRPQSTFEDVRKSIQSEHMDAIALRLDDEDYGKMTVDNLAGVAERIFEARGNRPPLQVILENFENKNVIMVLTNAPALDVQAKKTQ